MSKDSTVALKPVPEFKMNGWKKLAQELLVDSDLIEAVELADAWYGHDDILQSDDTLSRAALTVEDLEKFGALCDIAQLERKGNLFKMQSIEVVPGIHSVMKSRLDVIQNKTQKLAEGPCAVLVDKMQTALKAGESAETDLEKLASLDEGIDEEAKRAAAIVSSENVAAIMDGITKYLKLTSSSARLKIKVPEQTFDYMWKSSDGAPKIHEKHEGSDAGLGCEFLGHLVTLREWSHAQCIDVLEFKSIDVLGCARVLTTSSLSLARTMWSNYRESARNLAHSVEKSCPAKATMMDLRLIKPDGGKERQALVKLEVCQEFPFQVNALKAIGGFLSELAAKAPQLCKDSQEILKLLPIDLLTTNY